MNVNDIKVVSLHLARVDAVFFGHKEKLNDKRMYCDLYTQDGIFLENVPFFGGTVDIKTKNLHGTFIPPVKDQMVGLLFTKGHFENPYAAFSIPFPWENARDRELFGTKFLEQLEDIENGGMFHKSGSRIIQKKDGSVEIKNANGTGTVKILADGTIEINGNTDNAVRFSALETAYNDLKSKWNAFALAYVPGGPTVVGLPPTAAQSTGDITLAKIDTVKVP